ncbi:MAG: hypothetical protein AB1916_00240 [Thermodesulfobacteriota bacterium]
MRKKKRHGKMHKLTAGIGASIMGASLLLNGCVTTKNPMVGPASAYGLNPDLKNAVEQHQQYKVFVCEDKGKPSAVVFADTRTGFGLKPDGEGWREVTDQKELEAIIQDIKWRNSSSPYVQAITTYDEATGQRKPVALLYTPGNVKMFPVPENPSLITIKTVEYAEAKGGGGNAGGAGAAGGGGGGVNI